MKYLIMFLVVVALAGCGKGDVTNSGWYCMGCKEPAPATDHTQLPWTRNTCPNCGGRTFIHNDAEDLTRQGGEFSR